MKPKYSSAQHTRLEAISAQLQNVESSLPELSKNALRKEALQIHKDAETREKLRVEEKAAAKKKRAEAKISAARQKSDYPAKPTLESCNGDEITYRREVELWQLRLDERAAQKILDSPKSSLFYRDGAKRALRKCEDRRNEIESKAKSHVRLPAEPPAVREHRPQYEHTLTEWLAAEAKLREENPAEYARQQQINREAEEKRIANLGQVIEWGNRKSTVPTNPDGSYIWSPLQKKVWGEQSREFARRRGEIVDEPVTVELPDRSTAYRLEDFLFWGDNTPCESPLPAGTKILNAPTPPFYRKGENQIPSGMKFDPINFVWMYV